MRTLLTLYTRDMPITKQSVGLEAPSEQWKLDLWLSIMETENVLNALPGRSGNYSLFRMHHTVNQVANALSSGSTTPQPEGE